MPYRKKVVVVVAVVATALSIVTTVGQDVDRSRPVTRQQVVAEIEWPSLPVPDDAI